VQVMRLDVPLDGSMMAMERRVDKRLEAGRALLAAVSFLKEHSTAKIVVIVDTHCLDESGLFIWGRGMKAGDLEACCLEDVRVARPWNTAPSHLLSMPRSSRHAFQNRSGRSCVLTRRAPSTTTNPSF
jgi:hypothetical protein